jgi:hypothetical protein
MEERQPRSFTDDYKRQAVDLVASSGRNRRARFGYLRQAWADIRA